MKVSIILKDPPRPVCKTSVCDTHNRWYEMEALSVAFTYEPSADKDVRSCRVKNGMLKICGSVSMPVLTLRHGICGNWNTTPGDKKKVKKHPCSLFSVPCRGAPSSRVQMRLRRSEQRWQVPFVAALCHHSCSSGQGAGWHSPLCSNIGHPTEQGAKPIWTVYFYMLSFFPFSSKY